VSDTDTSDPTPAPALPIPSAGPLWHRPAFWVLTGLALRLALLPINHAEYTDGYLQLLALEMPVGLYPPLYGWLAGILTAVLGLPLETSGKLISAIASALTVLPLWWLCRLAGSGPRGAAWAAAFFTVSPLVLRWSVRVMTDSLFLGLATAALAFWTACLLVNRPDQDPKDARPQSTAGYYWLGTAFAVLATLTRWQGLALLPLGLGVAILVRGRGHSSAVRLLPALFLWLLVPAATYLTGFAHGGQFSERTTGQTLTTLLAYWNTAESFVLIGPYFFGYPLVALAIFQVARSGFAPGSQPVMALWIAYALAFLAAQSAFGSFQHRYMMPLLPMVLVPAGLLMDRGNFSAIRHRGVWILGTITLLWLAFQSSLVLYLQRGTFGDQKEVAVWAGGNIPADLPILSNERYGNFLSVGSLKQARWSGRKVTTIAALTDIPRRRFALIVSNAYGGDQAVSALISAVSSTHQLRPLFVAERTVTAIQDDVMANPMLNQNPLGWVLRYTPQQFRTQILLAEPRP
jgi:hypothetical protein